MRFFLFIRTLLLYNAAVLGILIANTGSPAAPAPAAVRRYLAEFLSDPRIIDIPRYVWLPVLYGVILNLRPSRSARLYRRIWTETGSPLVETTQKIAQTLQVALSGRLTGKFCVAAGMRYGEPSITHALRSLQASGVDRLSVLPLFPQYSATTIASVFDAVFAELRHWSHIPPLRLISGYHDHPAYIQSICASLRTAWAAGDPPDRLLFSFHGLPASYARRGDPYADQCRHTAELVAQNLDLPAGRWQVAFQSRFGRQEWIQPYTAQTLKTLGGEHTNRLSVVCPGFAADCLETLDEIANEGRKLFLEAGGGRFKYVPALNATAEHISALIEILEI